MYFYKSPPFSRTFISIQTDFSYALVQMAEQGVGLVNRQLLLRSKMDNEVVESHVRPRFEWTRIDQGDLESFFYAPNPSRQLTVIALHDFYCSFFFPVTNF